MKKLLAATLLAFNLATTVNSAPLTEDDIDSIHTRLNYIRECYYDDLENYKQAFQEDFQFSNKVSHQFSLESGIEINIDPENIKVLQAMPGDFPYGQSLEEQSNHAILNINFQNITFETTPPITVQARQQYGPECTMKFYEHQNSIRLGLVLDKPCYIDGGKYQITNIKFTEPLNPLAKSMIFSSNNFCGSDTQIIRYLNPSNQNTNYGFFLVNNINYDPNYKSENLLVTFDVVQAQKEF